MVFGTVLGAAAGFLGGAYAYIKLHFGAAKAPLPKTYDYIDVEADTNSEFCEEWNTDAKDDEVKRILARSPFWCTYPDYDRFLWLNNFINVVWEQNSIATKKTVEQVIRDGMPEWQKLTSDSTKGMVTLDELKFDNFDFGKSPLRCAGVKLYSTSQDEIILDMPIQWGSQLDVKVSATVGLLKEAAKFKLTATVKNLQVSACARITMRPLVEEIPILGAVNITLMSDPIVDLELYLDDGPDILGTPLTRTLINQIVKMALGKLLVYPNSMTFDIMPNAGLPPPMAGMLVVKVVGCTKLPSSFHDKIDPYVEVEVRKGRSLSTAVIDNNESPVFTEEDNNTMRFVIDDTKQQKIKVVVKDSDIIMDATVGYVEIPLKNAPFVLNPRKTYYYDAGLQLMSKKDRKKAYAMDLVDEEKEDLPSPSSPKPEGSPASAPPAVPSPSQDSTTAKDGQSKWHIGRKKKPSGPIKSEEEMAHSVTLPGSGKQGSVQLEVMFYPFDTEEEVGAAGKKRGQLDTIADVKDTHRAVITATLMACYNLEESVDPWVEITLYDKLQGRSETVRSSVKLNECNPRWDMKFDFVDVSAASRVTIVVFDKGTSSLLPGLVSSAMSAVVGIVKKSAPRKLGWIELPLTDVAKNGIVKDRFNLRDAVKGEIELKFEWHTIKRQAEDQKVIEDQMAAFHVKEDQDKADRAAAHAARKKV